MRRSSEVKRAAKRAAEEVWIRRTHKRMSNEIMDGKRIVVDALPSAIQPEDRRKYVLAAIWSTALRSAERIYDEHGHEFDEPLGEFEWGVLNGRMAAFRWVLGDEWDNFDC